MPNLFVAKEGEDGLEVSQNSDPFSEVPRIRMTGANGFGEYHLGLGVSSL